MVVVVVVAVLGGAAVADEDMTGRWRSLLAVACWSWLGGGLAWVVVVVVDVVVVVVVIVVVVRVPTFVWPSFAAGWPMRCKAEAR